MKNRWMAVLGVAVLLAVVAAANGSDGPQKQKKSAAEYAEWAQQMAEEHSHWAEEMGDADFDFDWDQEPVVVFAGDDSGWLGVTIEEVNAERVKEKKLPAERGVFVGEVSEDSPAAKAGLKAGDVITEFNGQPVEGTMQFRRFVRETPAGRTVKLTVWRDGRSQTVSVELGNAGERMQMGRRMQVEPRIHIEPPDFNIEIPRWESFGMLARAPMLGIQADDLSGQLGSYFGAPDGEGVLVREVMQGSPAEKGGLKAGDVIVKVDGNRVRTTSELRSQLREKRESKTVALGVIRKGAETTVNVEIEQPKPPERGLRTMRRRTAI